jgi:hypothetical protein
VIFVSPFYRKLLVPSSLAEDVSQSRPPGAIPIRSIACDGGGCPDFIVVVKGYHLWFEFKRYGGELSPERTEKGSVNKS